MSSKDEVAAAGEEALQTFLRRIGKSELSTGRFILLAETIDTAGKKGMWLVSHAEAPKWETMGMLTYALAVEHEGMDEAEE